MDSFQATALLQRASFARQRQCNRAMYNSTHEQQQQQTGTYEQHQDFLMDDQPEDNHQPTLEIYDSTISHRQLQGNTEKSEYLHLAQPDLANAPYTHIYPPSRPLTTANVGLYSYFTSPPHLLPQYRALDPDNVEFWVDGSYVGNGIWRARLIYAPVRISDEDENENEDENQDVEMDSEMGSDVEDEDEEEMETDLNNWHVPLGRGRLLTPESDWDSDSDPQEEADEGSSWDP